jgi:6,7-dimethyl-8-ribityllumazine synthase
MLKAKIPISFGILTVYNDDQAVKRSLPNAHNKGREAAGAVYETLQILERIHETVEND